MTKRSISRAVGFVVAAALVPAVAGAQPVRGGAPKPSMIVSTSWLAEHARDANLVVLQVGPKAQFDSVHIPGARQVSLTDITLGQAAAGTPQDVGGKQRYR